MTALVAILTKQCVALAADSAVTTGEHKIFNTINKVFALSKHHPVGIMVYNNAYVMGVPVETAIKEYRRISGSRSFASLKDYAIDFEQFLKTNTSLFNDDSRHESLASIAWEVVTEIRDRSLENLERPWKRWGHPNEKEVSKALLEVIDYFEKCVEKAKSIQVDKPQKARRAIATTIDGEVDKAIKWLDDILPPTASIKKRIRSLILDQFFCEVSFGGHTGFVIAGFGSEEVFPRLNAFEFCCSDLGIHKVRTGISLAVSNKSSAFIAPFAQADVMQTFVEGMDPNYRSAIDSFLEAFFESKKEKLLQSNTQPSQEIAIVESLGKELKQALGNALKELGKEVFIDPLIGVVASMPKEELAILAEALINLTALKRRASSDEETVGGPTDVAIISKGDGFIWIKRKHYFDTTLNPGFAQRYLEVCDEEQEAEI